MISKRISFQAFFLAGAFMACTAMGADDVLKSGPFINIWLVAGTFDNDEKNRVSASEERSIRGMWRSYERS